MKRINFLKKKIFFGVISIFIVLAVMIFISIKIFILKKSINNGIIAENIFDRTMVVAADIDYEPYSFIREDECPLGMILN